MRMARLAWLRFFAVLMMGMVAMADTPINVAGNWTVSASSGRRKVTQTLVIQQNGDKISGSFKGPRQSGTLSGNISGNSVTFHVDAKMPLDYTGTVNGDSMTGKLTGEGRTGDFTARRSK